MLVDKTMAVCGNNIVSAKIELHGKIVVQISEFKYSMNRDLECRIQTFNRMNGVIRRTVAKKRRNELK
jgi:hypothetical protein